MNLLPLIKLAKQTAANSLVVALTLLASEGAARLLGFTTVDVDSSPGMYASLSADPWLGWRMKPGILDYPQGVESFRYEILSDGTRSLGAFHSSIVADKTEQKKLL
jgi:hypothetical protein